MCSGPCSNHSGHMVDLTCRDGFHGTGWDTPH